MEWVKLVNQIFIYQVVGLFGRYRTRLFIYSDKNTLHFGSIVIAFGARYKSYCSNIVRTLLVDPSEEVQKTYSALVVVEEEIIAKLQHGAYCCRF